MNQSGCAICNRLSPNELLELDQVAGDPATWPSSVWGILAPPRGSALPASYRRYGAEEMSRRWLEAHGYGDIASKYVLRRHIRYDVVHLPRDAADLVEIGVMAGTRTSQALIPAVPRMDPEAFLTYFNRGITMGNSALELLTHRINGYIEKDEDPPERLVLELAKLGAKLATTQAQLRQRGMRFGEDENEDDAFRGGAELPSERIGHHRIRTVGGERRPVRDEGQADRDVFNARSREEGSPTLD